MNGWMDDGQEAEVDKRQRSDIGGQKTKRRDGWMNRMTGWKKAGSKDLRFRSTVDIILAAEKGLLPDKVMINTHPQRWTDNPVEWTKELVWQNVKNVVKRIIVRRLRRLTQIKRRKDRRKS